MSESKRLLSFSSKALLEASTALIQAILLCMIRKHQEILTGFQEGNGGEGAHLPPPTWLLMHSRSGHGLGARCTHCTTSVNH